MRFGLYYKIYLNTQIKHITISIVVNYKMQWILIGADLGTSIDEAKLANAAIYRTQIVSLRHQRKQQNNKIRCKSNFIFATLAALTLPDDDE